MAALADLFRFKPVAKQEVPEGMTPDKANHALHIAITAGGSTRKQLAIWLAAGANPNEYYRPCTSTLLYEAISFKRSEMVMQMLDHLQENGIAPANISSLLYHAIDKNLPELVERLLVMGASPDADPNTAQRPLVMDALNSGKDIAMLHSLIRHGAKLDYRNPNTQDTILHYAVGADRADVIEALLDAGMEVDATDNTGKSPLHKAAIDGYEDSLNALLKGGANIDLRDHGGRKPLHLAVARNQASIVRKLAAAGADLNERGISGRSPMSEASHSAHHGIYNILDVLGAYIDDELRPKPPFSTWYTISAERYDGWLRKGCDVRNLTSDTVLACGNIGTLKEVSSPALWRGHEQEFVTLASQLPPYIVKQMLTCEPELATLFAKPKPVIEGWSAVVDAKEVVQWQR